MNFNSKTIRFHEAIESPRREHPNIRRDFRENELRLISDLRKARDRVGVARAQTNIAVLLWHQGDVVASKEMFEVGLAVFREAGNKFAMAAALNHRKRSQRSR